MTPCPLCGGTNADPVTAHPYADSFAALRDRFGPSITSDLEAAYTPAPDAVLVECTRCGLQHFSPPNPGGPDFYAALAASGAYYGDDRWEYAIALAAGGDTPRVLDVGCGRGDFLLQAQAAGADVLACETNPEAQTHLAERGIPIYGINYKDDDTDALRWLEELGDPYIANIADREGTLGLDLGVYGAPETYLVDADGIVRYRHVGVVDERVWQTVLGPIYAELSKEGTAR